MPLCAADRGSELRLVRLGTKCSPDIKHLLLDSQVQRANMKRKILYHFKV